LIVTPSDHHWKWLIWAINTRSNRKSGNGFIVTFGIVPKPETDMVTLKQGITLFPFVTKPSNCHWFYRKRTFMEQRYVLF
jgi:hypothetical protein